MIVTAIVACRDGMGVSRERSHADLVAMFGDELAARGDTCETLDIDDVVLVQRGRTRLFHCGTELDPTDRVYAPSPLSLCPLRERKLANLYHVLLELGLPLLNRSFSASPELEVNKTVMQAVVAGLGVPCIPTMDVASVASPESQLSSALALGFNFPMVLKPNRLSNGIGILRCDDRPDFIEQVRLVQSLKADYLLQPYTPHIGDLRTFFSRDGIIGHQIRQPAVGEFRANLSAGAEWRAFELPADAEGWGLRIAARCDADYLVIDWLVTATGCVFNEMCSTLAAFMGVPPGMKSRLANAVLDIGHRKLASAASTAPRRTDQASTPIGSSSAPRLS